MALTLLESAKSSKDTVKKGVIKTIVESAPMLQKVPWKTIDGSAFSYDVERLLPGVAFRAVGETYPRSTGMIVPVTERLVIAGGEIFIDLFQIHTHSNKYDLKAQQWDMKSRALGIAFSEKFFEGDSVANIREFDGMRSRLTGSQLVDAGDGGATLTLAMLDQSLDKVVGMGEGVDIYLNKTLRRKITDLGRNAAGGFSFIDTGDDAFGHQVMRYKGRPLVVVEREDNEGTFLDFDEDEGTGGVANTASIYFLRFGDRFIHGIQGKGGSMEVYDLGESQTEPGIIGRIEWYVGLVTPHPRAGVRLYHINNA